MSQSQKLAATALVASLFLCVAPCLAQIPAAERAALVALYESAGGEGWNDATGWNGPPGGECGWAGVQCDGGSVYRLSLAGNHLVGSLPNEIGDFPAIQILNLRGNELSGEIPSEIGNLESLRSLSLDFNGFSGEIPSRVGDLVLLEELFVQDNDLTGRIPRELGKLSNLEHLEAWGNALSGPIPGEIRNLTRLEIVNLDGNHLSGELPTGLNTLVNLAELHLRGNQLTGSIPAELGLLPSIETIDLRGNVLSGSIPVELGNSPALKNLELAGNGLTGSIPPFTGAVALETLDLSGNGLSSSIPAALGSLPAIREIDLAGNDLEGEIPEELGDASTLETLDLSGNQLPGGIPATIGKLSSLVTLRLDNNPLGGSIPPELGSLSSLKTLRLDRTLLTGEIPPQLGNLLSIEQLVLGTANSGGTEDNQLTGAIPSGLGKLQNLRELNLGWNLLEGEIPPELGDLDQLRELVLTGNGLTGMIPAELGNLSSLEYLLLGHNGLEGPIPQELTTLRDLRWLHLHANRLSGPIPPSIGDLVSLTQLLLDRNELTGAVPDGITQLTNLNWLDLSWNRLSGSLPARIGDLGNLSSLTLSRSGLGGDLPPSFWSLSSLRTARLAGNDFSGQLPPDPASLRDLKILTLSGNRIDGVIPPGIGQLLALEQLDLSGNRLEGPVPGTIGQLSRLSTLDLSRNALSGAVPGSLGRMPALESIDLRYNALHTRDRGLREALRSIEVGDWEATQTVTPERINVGGVDRQRPLRRAGGSLAITDRSVEVTWQPIRYQSHDGGYEVTATPIDGGVPVVATTTGKRASGITVRGLAPDTDYGMTVRATTHPHGAQKNLVRSSPSSRIVVRTKERSFRPAEVDLVSAATGLIQIDGVPQNTGQYVLGNFGDVETTIILDFEPDFFTETPKTFTLGAGETQVVTLESIAGQPAGTRWGNSYPRGDGVPQGLVVPVALLSTEQPDGTVAAQAVRSRVDVNGPVGSTTSAQVTFRNVGTATLEGVLLSDVPWIVTTPERIVRISPGSSVTESFTIARDKRPVSVGSLSGSLRLVYVAGSSGKHGSVSRQTGTSTSTSLVTVVDTARPPVQPGDIPPLKPGETGLVVPGAQSTDVPSVLTDLSVVNELEDLPSLQLFHRGLEQIETSVATIEALGVGQYFKAANVLASLFETIGSGTLHVRVPGSEVPAVHAQMVGLEPSGQLLGYAPVFSTDAAAAAGEKIQLVGIPAIDPTASRSKIFLQEAVGGAVTALVRFFDEAGDELDGPPGEIQLEPYELHEIENGIPEGAARITLSSSESSSGRFVAWASIRSTESDDFISLVDWAGFFHLPEVSALRVPFVTGADGIRTELTLANPGAADATGSLVYFDSDGEPTEQAIALGPGETWVIGSLTDQLGLDGQARGSLVVEPDAEGEESSNASIQVSARIIRTTEPTPSLSVIPVVPDSSGMRLGQSRLFTDLEHLAPETIGEASPTGFRTGFGIGETTGQSIVVRVTLHLRISGTLAAASTEASRDLEVPPHGMLRFDDVVRAILGDGVADSIGDLRNLEMEFQVIDGEGAATPFVRIVEVGSGDVAYRF